MKNALLLDFVCYLSLMLIALVYSMNSSNFLVLGIASVITLSYALVVQRIKMLRKQKLQEAEIYSKYC